MNARFFVSVVESVVEPEDRYTENKKNKEISIQEPPEDRNVNLEPIYWKPSNTGFLRNPGNHY